MRRLYLQIYLAFVGILLLFGVLLAAFWWVLPGESGDRRNLNGMALLLADSLPPEQAGSSALQADG